MMNFIVVDIKNHNDKGGYPEQDQHSLILILIPCLSALKTGHQYPWNSPDGGDDKKNGLQKCMGVSPEDIAECILRKTRD